MSDLIIASKLFVKLSEEQQELLGGGADYELNNTNFAERVKASIESRANGPLGDAAFSLDLDKSINTAAQDFLGFGGVIPENITALPPPPIL
ncbi:MAG: CTB family bacteriocin [Gloeotrichia echinulata DVL01]|jgi:hypothetical protein